ncbi:MAG TPA: TonB-dependent receptor [Sphingomicrobium sp.]|nr:TonB-dependent receptor [Sphingomicrobium sp.]
MFVVQDLPPPDPQSDAIVVTGKSLPDPAAERAFGVETISRERLTDSPSRRMDEILKQVPGVQLFRRSDSSSAHPTSQGVTLRALGGNAASRALVVMDGVPQADPFGGWVPWPAYDPAGLGQVRVLRGGGSVAHGPGALAGVIEMTSLAEPLSSASIDVGSRGAIVGSALAGTAIGRGLVTVNAHGMRGDGFVPQTEESRGPVDRPAPYRQGSGRVRFVAPLGSEVELQASAAAFADVRERGVPFTGNRTRGADTSLRLVGSGRWQWAATGYAQWRNFRSSFATIDDARTQAQQVSLQDSVPARGLGLGVEVRPPVGEGIEFRLGGDARFTRGESRELYAFTAGEPTRRRVAGGRSGAQGVFAELAVIRQALTLSVGARVDRWQVLDGELVERLLSTGIATRDERYPSRSGWLPTARAGAAFDAGGGWTLRSAAYLGWRLPTLNELFRPFRAGADATAANPLLEPEKLAGGEAGLSYQRGAVSLSVTAFVNGLRDSIANVSLGMGPGLFPGVGFVDRDYRQRLNIDQVRVRGLEASGQARHGPFAFSLGASYSHARVVAGGSAAGLDGLRPAQTPDLVVSGEARWTRGRASAALAIRHVAGQFEDDLNARLLPSATTLDAFLAWPVAKRVQLVGRSENLLGETVAAGISSDGAVERATPRTFWLGLRLT